MKNPTRHVPLIVLLCALPLGAAQAQDASCMERAQNNHDIDQCGAPLIAAIEAKVDSDIKRLREKYVGNERMQEALKNTRHAWQDYRNNLCVLEAGTAHGSEAMQPFSITTNKLYFQCVQRKLEEMRQLLSRF